MDQKKSKRIKKVKNTISKIKKVEEIKRQESELEKEISESDLEDFAQFLDEGEKEEDITPVMREVETRQVTAPQPREIREETAETGNAPDISYDLTANPYLEVNLRTQTGGEAVAPRQADYYREYSPVMRMRTSGGEAVATSRGFGGEAVAPSRILKDGERTTLNQEGLERDYIEGQREEKKKRRWRGEV